MQTALLSAGIAIILALVTALVGPFFVDWGSWRSEVEAEVGHLTGLQVRVAGPIDVRFLPTPTLTMQQIELGRPGEAAKTRARALRIEFALSDLMRGALRAPDLELEGPELLLSLDPSGRLAWSAPTMGLDPDAVSIEHLEIKDGRATLADAASGTRLSLDKLEFTGQVRSLLGPVKGEGSFAIDGQNHQFRLSVSRPADDGGIKVRLVVDPTDHPGVEPTDHPRTVDVDGSIWVEQGLPRFEGVLQLTRPVSRSPDGVVESWRITSHVSADGAAAKLDQVEFQYGPDDRAIRLKGDAKLTYGAKLELAANLSAPQVDLDRILAVPEAAGRRPLAAIKTLAEAFVRAQHLPIPVRLRINADAVTLAGATLQRVAGRLKSDGDSWTIEDFVVRVPGLTRVAFSGRLGAATGGLAFDGQTEIDTADPRALIGWLTDPGNAQGAPSGPLHLAGNVALSGDRIAFDRLQVQLDHMEVGGHLDYAWPDRDRPARLNAALHAPTLDLDRAQSLLLASLGPPSQWPSEGTLAIEIDQTVVAGVEAKDIVVKMRRDGGSLDIERFAIGNLGGAKLTVTGRMDNMVLNLEARGLDGIAALIGKFSTPVAERIRRSAGRSLPVALHGSISTDRRAAGASGGSTSAKLTLQGTAGVFRLDLRGDAGGGALASLDPAQLGAIKLNLTGVVDASDGGALVDILGLDRLVTVSQRSGQLRLELNGPLDGDVAVNGALRAGGLDVTAKGSLHPAGSAGPTAQMELEVSADGVVPLRSVTSRRAVQAPWSRLNARLRLADGIVTLGGLKGTLAGVGIEGELGIGMTDPMRMNGDISIGALDLPAAIGTTIGFPHRSGNGNGNNTWSVDPFEAGLLGNLGGQITVKAEQVALSSGLTARNLRAVLDFSPSGLAVADIDGVLAGGRIGGDFGFERGDGGVTAHGHLRLTDADAAELLGGGARGPLSGKLTADLALAGSGRSPIALIGSLEGAGTFALRDGGIARLDPAAFDLVTLAVDRGLPIDAARIGERMEAALAIGVLPISLAEGSIAASMGQLRLVDPVLHAKGAELKPTGSIDLTQSAIEARLVLSTPQGAGAAAGGHPDVSVTLRGPIGAPRRALEVAELAHWLALRAADQKEKRADALEQAAREHSDDAGETTGSPSDRDPRVPGAPGAPPRASRPGSVTITPGVNPAGTTGLPRSRPIQDPAAAAAGASAPEPRVRQAPPPPMDIRPQPPPHAPRG